MFKKNAKGILWGLERRVQLLLAAREAASVPSGGWLRAVREALGHTQARIAGKIGVKRQSYAQFENAEERGSVSIASLRRAATAMDCDLVYFLAPREGTARSYADLAQAHPSKTNYLQEKESPIAFERESGVLPVDLL